MAAPSIDGTAVPESMATRGPYTFHPQERFTNGAGQVITAGQQRIEWSLGTLTQADLDWWRTTILAGAESKTITAELWDHLGDVITITSAVLRAPRPVRKAGGLYHEITVEITNILPLV